MEINLAAQTSFRNIETLPNLMTDQDVEAQKAAEALAKRLVRDDFAFTLGKIDPHLAGVVLQSMEDQGFFAAFGRVLRDVASRLGYDNVSFVTLVNDFETSPNCISAAATMASIREKAAALDKDIFALV